MTGITVAELDRAEEERFVEVLGGIYEASPWVAKRAQDERPFSSVDDIHEAMRTVVEDASRERQLALLRAHPDLGERTEMTDESQAEQAAAGLDRLDPDQYAAFQRLNEAYRNEFGFPFIMAVKHESLDTIQKAMETRIEHSTDEELRTALDEVHAIARLRLDELVSA